MNIKLVAVLALAAIALAFAPTASAHASANTEDGKYRITWGFLDEPAFADQKNRLDLIIRELADPATNTTGAGVAGVTADDLTVTLVLGEETYDLGEVSAYRGPKGASAGPGNYTSDTPVYLTRPGIYSLHVQGTIHGSPVDLRIPAAHAYEAMSEIAFPDETIGGDAGALEARIATLESELAALKAQIQTQATNPATVTAQPTGGAIPAPAVLGVLGVLAAVSVAMALRRR